MQPNVSSPSAHVPASSRTTALEISVISSKDEVAPCLWQPGSQYAYLGREQFVAHRTKGKVVLNGHSAHTAADTAAQGESRRLALVSNLGFGVCRGLGLHFDDNLLFY